MIKAKDARIITKGDDIILPPDMRTIKYGVAHCTSGPQNQSVQEILNYWEKHNKWSKPGYHFIIEASGKISQLVPINVASNGVAGYNSHAIHFCYTGGISAKGEAIDNRTEAQKVSQILIIKRLKELFPNIVILGHRDFSTDTNGNGIIEKWEWIKACPSFDVREWLSAVGLDKHVVPSKIVYKLNYPLIKNDTVKLIQKALGVVDDGYYGADTDKAVKAFQAKHNLVVDGVVGPKTAELLKIKL